MGPAAARPRERARLAGVADDRVIAASAVIERPADTVVLGRPAGTVVVGPGQTVDALAAAYYSVLIDSVGDPR